MVVFMSDEIASRKNGVVKYAMSLFTSKGRKKENAYRFDGIKLFTEAFACGVKIETVLIKSESSEYIFGELDRRCPGWREELSASVFLLKEAVFDAISEENAPEGIICIAKSLDKSEKSGKIIRRENFCFGKNASNRPLRIMAAESLRDPGNLGSLIRTCMAFGVDRLMLSSDCADILSSKVIRSSMGAVFALDITVCEDLCAQLLSARSEGYRILAAALHREAIPLSEASLNVKDIFVIGNEGHGLSESVTDLADACVYIDMYSGPGCESLNASVAAAVCAWEQKRQIECKNI